jgi:hypothetical protein
MKGNQPVRKRNWKLRIGRFLFLIILMVPLAIAGLFGESLQHSSELYAATVELVGRPLADVLLGHLGDMICFIGPLVGTAIWMLWSRSKWGRDIRGRFNEAQY